jgi:hypothetical protein
VIEFADRNEAHRNKVRLHVLFGRRLQDLVKNGSGGFKISFGSSRMTQHVPWQPRLAPHFGTAPKNRNCLAWISGRRKGVPEMKETLWEVFLHFHRFSCFLHSLFEASALI